MLCVNYLMTRNAWQSRAYSPLGANKSSLVINIDTHLLTDRRLA